MYQKDDNRRNVFKLSGNMALGGALPDYSGGSYKGIGRPSEYSTEDISAAKNSLQLLKAKQQAKRAEEMLASDVHPIQPRAEVATSPRALIPTQTRRTITKGVLNWLH